jgi:antitoxin component of MazEF toxin-antitoxin module
LLRLREVRPLTTCRLDRSLTCDYGNYMKTTLVRIGNSRGLRLPSRLLAVYGINENDELELEERAEGILIRPALKASRKIPWEAAYREMASETAEAAEWSDWDAAAADGPER